MERKRNKLRPDFIMTNIEILDQLYRWGVKLFICGVPATPHKVEECLLREGDSYVPGYIFGEDGNIAEICYRKVSSVREKVNDAQTAWPD